MTSFISSRVISTSGQSERSTPPVKPERDDIRPRCPQCNYDLAGSLEGESHQCPECGCTWSVDDLARQHVARSSTRRGLEWIIWAFAPGPIVCAILFLGFVFGHVMWYISVGLALIYAVLMLVDWTRGLYTKSFSRGRAPSNRFLFVTVGLSIHMAVNVVEIVFIILVVRLVQSAMIGAG